MLIGITGKAGSGKDTVGDYLCQKGFGKTAFASTLKNMLLVAGLPEPNNRDDKEKIIEGFNFSYRKAAQLLGTEFGRALDEDFWVKMTMRKLDSIGYDKVVFTDVRFDNEAQAIRDRGGVILHLRGRQVELGENSGHASEVGVTIGFWDHVIENNGSIEDLYVKIDSIMKVLDGNS